MDRRRSSTASGTTSPQATNGTHTPSHGTGPARRVEQEWCREKGRIRVADDLAFMDATAQAELVSRGHVRPGELVDAAIDRIEKFNGELNAVVTPLFEKARAAAEGE